MKNRRLAAMLVAVLAVFTFAVPMASAQSTPTLSNIRTGAHTGFNRVVLDMSGLPAEHRVREVTSVRDCGPGNVVPMPGSNEILEVVMFGAAAHDDNGNPTYTGPRNFTPANTTNVRRVALTCDFEAVLTIAVGYSNTNSWHRVFTLTNPNRVVIDIGL
ncbi:hypothetical protein [Lentzea sp. NPDC051838]|uniref:AMIN-like domain-containing (lipo)protein n=1 Tax=Lentzea sp. NPDC051838 TaxID=3154849 RepID=UPI003418CC1D